LHNQTRSYRHPCEGNEPIDSKKRGHIRHDRRNRYRHERNSEKIWPSLCADGALFLVYGEYRVDLSEGNNNGKNRSIEDFLYTQWVEPNISAKDEYVLYRKALMDHILARKEMSGVDITQILRAREEGFKLLKRNINQS